MANPNFTATMSSNEIWRDLDDTRCITDDLDTIESNIAQLQTGKANSDHSHSNYSLTNHVHNYNDLTNKPTIPEAYVHPDNHPASMITGLSTVATTGNYTDLTNKPTIPSAYTHPENHPASMITGLSTVATSGSYNDLSNKPTIPSAYTHPASHPASMITGLASVATTGNYSDLNGKPTIPTIPASLPANGGNADTVDGKHASDFANASHSHELSAITGLLDMLLTDTNGKQKTTITGDVLTTIAGLQAGITTAYSAGGTNSTVTNAPNATESWRYLIHKNYANYGWVMAFGSEGSFFINYYDGGTWRGWKPIWDNNPSALWSGAYYMNANQTIYPSKKLSECKNGWVLLWSDYTSANGAGNGDVVATYIPKRCYDGSNWAGHSWLADIPTEATSSSEVRCVKKLYMWNNRIVGNSINETSPRNNVVLRGVYEF